MQPNNNKQTTANKQKTNKPNNNNKQTKNEHKLL